MIRRVPMPFPPGHLYSPIVDPGELDPQRLWPERPDMRGIDFNDESHREVLTHDFRRFHPLFAYPEDVQRASFLSQTILSGNKNKSISLTVEVPPDMARGRLCIRAAHALVLNATMGRRYHYYVYVIELSKDVLYEARFKKANPDYVPGKPCVYVGMTGLNPDARFDKHKAGIQSNRFVRLFGLRLLPELYEVYNPMPYDGARDMEVKLAIGLREAGYGVWQA